MLHVLLVDDDALIRSSLAQTLNGFPYVSVVGAAASGEEAVTMLQKESVDLIFLDIELGDIDGFALARHIQQVHPNVMIVFLTGHVGFAVDGYEYKPLDFLIKPVNLLRLERVLLRARELKEKVEAPQEKSVKIGLSVDGGLEIIEVNSILYIERLGRRIFLVDRTGKRYQSYDSLQKLEAIFEPYGFIRCHQSFLVRFSAIAGVHLDKTKSGYTLRLSGTETEIPLSRGKYSELREKLARSGMIVV